MFGDDGKQLCLKAPKSPLSPASYGASDTADPEPWFKKTTPPRWLNAGSIIGFNSIAISKEGGGENGMKTLFSGISDAEVETAYDDQAILLQRFLDGGHGITLDYYSELFQTFEAATNDLQLRNLSIPLTPYEDEYSKNGNARWYWQNDFTKKIPVLLHFNGEGKSGDHMNRVWKDLVCTVSSYAS